MEIWDAIVIGGGIAGAAAGCGLARRGQRVLLLERETVAGVHATGRNAAILRHGFGPPSDRALARETRRLVRSGELGDIELRPTGSLSPVSGPEGLSRLESESRALVGSGIRARIVDHAEVVATVPLLAGCGFDAALACPDDGVLDVHAMHQAMLAGLRRENGRVELGVKVVRVQTDDAGVSGVETNRGTFPTRKVLDAAGPWAEEVAATCGAGPIGLRPCRRHLLVTEPHASIDPAWPVVWDVTEQIYFRPESGGLLLCPCDESELEPCDCRADPHVLDWGIEKLVRHVPLLAGFGVSRSWAGLRTLSPDGPCVVGPDPRVEGLFWVAGLGGHGISAAGGLMRLVPDLLLEGGTDLLDAAEVAPARFV
jgi:D-arginine dehydrogenase